MNREIVDRGCERGILALVLAILVFGPLAMGAVATGPFLIIQALTLGVLVLWGVRLWLRPRVQLLVPPISWAVLAFVAYAVFRYFTADLEYVARLEVIRVLVYAFLFFAIVNNLHRQEHMQIIVLTLIFLAMAIAGYGLYQFIADSDKVWTLTNPYKHRGSGTYINPNHFAGFLEMILPLGLAWLLVSRAKPVARVFIAYASLVILGGIVVSLSRGSWISVGFMLAVFFGVLLFHRAYRVPSIVMLVVLVGAGMYFLPRTHFFKSRWREVTAHEQFNDSARFDLWQPAVRMWKDHNIWWGVGPNHYNHRFRAYRPQVQQQQPDRVHNDYLNTLVDWGIVGVALVSAAWALLGVGVAKTWRSVRGSAATLGSGNSNKFALVLGSSLGLLAILFHSVIDFNMHIPANAILAVALMALLTASLRFATERYWITARIGLKLCVTVLVLAGISVLGWQLARGTGEYRLLRQAQRAPASSPQRIAALQNAFAAEPQNAATAYRIGKALREQSDGDEAMATQALAWLERSIRLNPYDGYSYLQYGICLDWPLERVAEAEPYFKKAVELDPNGYFTAAYMGWHYVQTGDYAAARAWFERSQRLEWRDNDIADTYLPIVNRLLLRSATNPLAVTTPQKNPD